MRLCAGGPKNIIIIIMIIITVLSKVKIYTARHHCAISSVLDVVVLSRRKEHQAVSLSESGKELNVDDTAQQR